MELLESRRLSYSRKTRLNGSFQPWHVVVVVDATTELKLAALRYALENFVRPADKLSLLGILHPFACSVDDEQKGDRGPKFDKNVMDVTETIWKKHAEFHKCISDKDIYQLVQLKKVIFDVKIATGPDRKLVMAKQAVDLQASWVILEQDLREDKEFLMQKLNCNVVLMNSRDEAAIIKLELPDAENPNVLEWKNRWTIAVGTARAIRYLHEECGIGCTVHRDSNTIPVLFDVVGVFSQSRSREPSSDEAKETRCLGMRGYLAPEYSEYGNITDRADVYSFGILLLQLISGRKAIDSGSADGQKSVTEWVRPLIQEGKTLDIVDPRLRNFCDVDQATKMVDVAARCISIDPSKRPNIREVLSLLEHDKNCVSSISIGSSANDVSDILRDPATKCLLQTNLITFQTNLVTVPGGLNCTSPSTGDGLAVASSNGTKHRGSGGMIVGRMIGIERRSGPKASTDIKSSKSCSAKVAAQSSAKVGTPSSAKVAPRSAKVGTPSSARVGTPSSTKVVARMKQTLSYDDMLI